MRQFHGAYFSVFAYGGIVPTMRLNIERVRHIGVPYYYFA